MGKYGRRGPIPHTPVPFSSATAPNIRPLKDKGETARASDGAYQAKRGRGPNEATAPFATPRSEGPAWGLRQSISVDFYLPTSEPANAAEISRFAALGQAPHPAGIPSSGARGYDALRRVK